MLFNYFQTIDPLDLSSHVQKMLVIFQLKEMVILQEQKMGMVIAFSMVFSNFRHRCLES